MPMIEGARIPVDLISEKLATDETVQNLLEVYPCLEEVVRAALAYAVAVLCFEAARLPFVA